MQVDPARLAELAVRSEALLTAVADDWARAQVELATACASLGDAVGTTHFASAYAETLTDAAAVVAALTYALEWGVAGLVDAARDAVDADETAACELGRAATSIGRARVPEPGAGP